MSFGRSVTTFIADLYEDDDHLAPQDTGDFARAYPTDPIKGAAVSLFVQGLYPTDPIQPIGLGSALSDYINDFDGPDLGDGGLLFL